MLVTKTSVPSVLLLKTKECSNPPSSQPAFLQDGGKDIPIQLCPIWPLYSPKGLYKDAEASRGDAQISWHPAGNSHGLHAVDGKLEADADRARSTLTVSPREPGIHYKQPHLFN